MFAPAETVPADIVIGIDQSRTSTAVMWRWQSMARLPLRVRANQVALRVLLSRARSLVLGVVRPAKLRAAA